MRIQFCGADRTVTGSSHLLEINGLRIFLDMGLYQGPRAVTQQVNNHFPADVKSADAIILSHGHLDHCGKLPMATKARYRGPIYVTPASAEVARVVLNDSAAIQVENVDFLKCRNSQPGDADCTPLYTPQDVPPVLAQFKRVEYGFKTDLGKGVSFTFFDAGHIIGAAYVILEWKEGTRQRNLLFTADIGRYDAPILRDPQTLPGPMEQIITESTYGNTAHAPMDQVGPQFLDAVKYCIARKSRLLIPSFAVGRTQTVLWYIQRFIQNKQIPEIPIFVDSPMGVEASKIHSQFRDLYDDETRAAIGTHDLFGMSRVTFASSVQDSKKINAQPGPCVIIASSPTCEFGRILHHLTVSANRADDLVIFVGYIPPQTLGRRLQEGQKRVRMLNQWFDVKFQVRTIHGLSAHADHSELLRFLKPALSPTTRAYVVHGEADQAEGFARRLLGTGISTATIPAMETALVDDSSAGGSSESDSEAVSEVGE